MNGQRPRLSCLFGLDGSGAKAKQQQETGANDHAEEYARIDAAV
jgi:hypothetical protein